MPMNWTLKMVKMAKFVIYVLSQLKNSILKKKGTAVKEGGKRQISYPISHSQSPTPRYSVFSDDTI